MISYEDVRASKRIRAYIERADMSLKEIGYTEHCFGHVVKCAEVAGDVLERLGFGARTAELARIAGYMHDIGNMINREDHAQTGAVMALGILEDMGMEPEEAAEVATAIGYHDETSAYPVSPIAAALILADKTDVRRSRVRSANTVSVDIHDRVNYAAVDSNVRLEPDKKTITLALRIDTDICSVMDYFEIFLNRMLLCRRAAGYFDLIFKLTINDTELL